MGVRARAIERLRGMTQDEKQKALYTLRDLEVRTSNLLIHRVERAERLSHEAYQLRLMQAELSGLRGLVENTSIEIDILPEDVPPTTWDRYVEGM